MPHRLQSLFSLASRWLHLIVCSLILIFSSPLLAQVGIGTTAPKAFFNVAQGKTVLFGGDSNQVGSTNKLIWYASQGAFRAGGVINDIWSRSSPTDETNVGQYSFASGYNTGAVGYASTAMGYYSFAYGNYSAAIGSSSGAMGTASVAIGSRPSATGNHSLAIGSQVDARGDYSMAMGSNTDASGRYSTAMGYYVSTNKQEGSFIIGDYASNYFTALRNDAPNQMMMRFTGGYRLYTNPGATIGVSLNAGSNAWSVISDSTRKENYRQVDGAIFLKKIATMRLGSWNYKGQDVKQYRHYGPMAQDFFLAFGNDGMGVVGDDKSINQADFDGVNLIAIQALIKEVQQLKVDNQQLRVELEAARQDGQTTRELARRVGRIEAQLNTQLETTAASLEP